MELAGIFSKIIKARRASGRTEQDVLQQFIDARWVGVWGGMHMRESHDVGVGGRGAHAHVCIV